MKPKRATFFIIVNRIRISRTPVIENRVSNNNVIRETPVHMAEAEVQANSEIIVANKIIEEITILISQKGIMNNQ